MTPHTRGRKRLIDEGYIGRPILFRGYSVDPESAIEGAIRFAPSSGGQFLDMSVHDIDLARWMLGGGAVPCFAAGGCYAHPEFAASGDGDNLAALVRFDNGAMAFFLAGQDGGARLHGGDGDHRHEGDAADRQRSPEGHGRAPGRARGRAGVLAELPRTLRSGVPRRGAGVRGLHQGGAQAAVTVHDGTMATKVAFAATRSFRRDELVRLE